MTDLKSRLEKVGKARARENFVAENPHLANDKYYEEKPELSMTYRSYLRGNTDLHGVILELADACRLTYEREDCTFCYEALQVLEAYLATGEGGKP